MIEVFVATLLVIFAYAAPGNYWFTPDTRYEAGWLDRPPAACRPATGSELKAMEVKPKGKAATYSQDSVAICERELYAHGERDSFYELVTRNAEPRAKQAATALATLLRAASADQRSLDALSPSDEPWYVRIDSSNVPAGAELHRLLRTLYVQELSSALGAGRVSRSVDLTKAPERMILVRLRRVQDVDLLFDVTAVAKGRTWRL